MAYRLPQQQENSSLYGDRFYDNVQQQDANSVGFYYHHPPNNVTTGYNGFLQNVPPTHTAYHPGNGRYIVEN